MTFEQFAPLFATLAMQLRASDADEPTAKMYFKVLKDEPAELVALAADRLAKTAEWFPKTSEWLACDRAIEHERADLQRRAVKARQKFGLPPLCADCEDTGFRRLPTARVTPCDCQGLRRLEILGARPLPALPSGPEPSDALDPRVDAAVKQLAASKGM